MDRYSFFAFFATAVAIARYGIYFYTIYKGETKPHLFSWILWGAVTGVGTLAQFDLQAGPSAWALAFVSVTCFFIAGLSLFIGERSYTISDWVALAVCVVAIFIWKVVRNPLLALLVIIAIDLLTYWPTIRKSFYQPDTEPPISYGLAGLRYFFMLFAVPYPSWENLMYPFFLMISDLGFGVYIVIRRAQLRLPLHEYAKVKPD